VISFFEKKLLPDHHMKTTQKKSPGHTIRSEGRMDTNTMATPQIHDNCMLKSRSRHDGGAAVAAARVKL